MGIQKRTNLKVVVFLLTLLVAMVISVTNVYCDDNTTNKDDGFKIGGNEQIDININAGNASGNAVEDLDEFLNGKDGLMILVTSAGSILIALGLGQIFLAFKDDNPDAKAKGTMVFLGGVLLVTLPGIIATINSLS